MRIFKYLTIIILLLSSIDIFAQNINTASSLENLIFKQDFTAHRESSSNDDLSKNGDNVSINPGETIVLGELSGPGIINHIWMTISAKDPFYGRSLVIRMYWEGNDKPSVETPIGDFFGVGHGVNASFESSPISTSSQGRAKNSFWKMPFLKNAKITITNESKEYSAGIYYYLDWEKHNSLPENIFYFHANYHQQFPAKPGDHTILETVGEGHYVGTIYSVQNMELGWFGEGDDRFYIDGEEYPSLSGTGTEDYFGDAWGFRPFDRPYYGVSLWEGYFPGDRVTAYRWHIQDPIPFKKSIKVTMEHHGSIFNDLGMQFGNFVERPDWVSSVAIWYQSKPVELKESIPPEGERIAPYQIIALKDLIIRTNPKQGLTLSDEGLAFIPMKPDASIEIDFKVEKEGRYQISAFMMHSIFSSRYQAYLDGKSLGSELDLYFSGNDPIWENFDLHDLSAGTHTLRFEGKGASPNMRSMAPPAYYFGIGHLILLRLEDMEGYREALKELSKKN